MGIVVKPFRAISRNGLLASSAHHVCHCNVQPAVQNSFILHQTVRIHPKTRAAGERRHRTDAAELTGNGECSVERPDASSSDPKHDLRVGRSNGRC